jgi:type II secretory pathway pseudopilin PulG
MKSLRRSQRGATLLVTLVLLVLIGLAAMVSYGSSARNVQVVGNMQMRGEAIAAAQQVIEQTISSSLFTREPEAVAADAKPVDIDGDGKPEYAVLLQPAPVCIALRPIRTLELDPANPADVGCLGSSGTSSGADFGAGVQANSLCRESMWNVAAVVSDAATGAQATLHQGVSVRISAADAANACP